MVGIGCILYINIILLSKTPKFYSNREHKSIFIHDYTKKLTNSYNEKENSFSFNGFWTFPQTQREDECKFMAHFDLIF